MATVLLLLKQNLEKSSRWKPDKLWNWTPLHYAASSGLAQIVDTLLQYQASPYALSSDSKTPQMLVKHDSREVQMLIERYILQEPAQCVLPSGCDRGALWLGSRQAAYPQFATDRGFTTFLSVFDRGIMLNGVDNMHKVTAPQQMNGVVGHKDPKLRWLTDSEECKKLKRHEIFIDLPDNHDAAPWYVLARTLKVCVDFIHDAIESTPLSTDLMLARNKISMCFRHKETILVHCDLGVSTSYCIVLAYMITKRRLRLRESMVHLQSIRHQLRLNMHLKSGLGAMERSFDARKLRRLEDRLRKAPILALDF